MKKLYFVITLLVFGSISSFGSVIKDLRVQILDMVEGESIQMKYDFVGCFGPYQKGEISFKQVGDTIFYSSKSYDGKTKNYINQSGKYAKNDLLNKLEKAKDESASEILGNSIHYQFYASENMKQKGTDYIDQRHFVEFFHPFSSFLEKGNFGNFKKSKAILKTPGIQKISNH